jgi:predicted nucleic acid-binding protein
MPFITNTTVLANFAAANQLELIPAVLGTVYIPEQVLDEVLTGYHLGYSFYENFQELVFPFASTGWLHLTSLQTADEFRLYGSLLTSLHSGEAACLSIAHHRSWTVLSDDKKARKVGRRMNIILSGTIGILLALVEENLLALNEANLLLQEMIRGGYHPPVNKLDELLPPK